MSQGSGQNREGASYRSRLAPSPTGYLHLGHARTFWIAQERCRRRNGTLLLRCDDLDAQRCKPEFKEAMIEDLKWFGFRWEGEVFHQSERGSRYREAFEKLRALGAIYPCHCSRRDVLNAVGAPHAGEDEPIYPGTCRPASREEALDKAWATSRDAASWRFWVPSGRELDFEDGYYGRQSLVAGRDFGDFVVWRSDDLVAYQLATVVDDGEMGITEIVRGQDLLRSTARQLLLFEGLGLSLPAFHHCPLLCDDSGMRMAKRHDSLSLRTLRQRGRHPEEFFKDWKEWAS